MAKVLIVEDDKFMAQMIADALKHLHLDVQVVHDGNEGHSRLSHYEYDVVILDWDLPQMSGVEICKQYRARGGTVPVLMLTGKGAINEKETGFDAGADDYVTKPFDIRELTFRVKAMLRRNFSSSGNVLQVGELSLDSAAYLASIGEQRIDLPKSEFMLLEFFMRHPNQIFSTETLLDRVWKTDTDASAATVRQTINRLRKKIHQDGKPEFIENIYGLGYRLNSTDN
jgi:DNA-binding response OmpR family regulator